LRVDVDCRRFAAGFEGEADTGAFGLRPEGIDGFGRDIFDTELFEMETELAAINGG
jgi:hypothetical protein